jgi:hypothetical protein
LAEASNFVDRIVGEIRDDFDRGDPATAHELADLLLDRFWAMACRQAEHSDDPNPNNWGPTLLATTLATALLRLAEREP